MKYRIHDGISSDSIVIEQDTLEDCFCQALDEANKRNWVKPWSERLEDI